jgi:hypothetical protein
VEPVAGTCLPGREVAWREFLCRREKGEGRRAADGRGYGFRVVFSAAVRRPVAMGYGAHFGMGGFVNEIDPIRHYALKRGIMRSLPIVWGGWVGSQVSIKSTFQTIQRLHG